MADTPLPLIKSGMHSAINGQIRRHHAAVAVSDSILRCAALDGPLTVTSAKVRQCTFKTAAVLVVGSQATALGNGQGRSQVGDPYAIVADRQFCILSILLYPQQNLPCFSFFCPNSCNGLIQQLENRLSGSRVVTSNGSKQGGAAGCE